MSVVHALTTYDIAGSEVSNSMSCPHAEILRCTAWDPKGRAMLLAAGHLLLHLQHLLPQASCNLTGRVLGCVALPPGLVWLRRTHWVSAWDFHQLLCLNNRRPPSSVSLITPVLGSSRIIADHVACKNSQGTLSGDVQHHLDSWSANGKALVKVL